MQNPNAAVTPCVYFSVTATIYMGNDGGTVERLNVETSHLVGDDTLMSK